MRAAAALVVVYSVLAHAVHNGTRYSFYRSMSEEGERGGGGRRFGGGRRVFGGAPAPLKEFPGVCALLDRYWAVRCSATVVRPNWALTAAHCVGPHVAYVKYNSRRPSSPDGDVAPVLFLYKHPGYRVESQETEGSSDVALLHHDVGLVRTRTQMRVAGASAGWDAVHSLPLFGPLELKNEEVQVLGFGRTDASPSGEELYGVHLRAVPCERGGWYHCVCAVGVAGGAAGVCSGDSGGPVVYRGVQVAVTSMGPVQCGARGGGAPPSGATSVLTVLQPYAALVLATINETDSSLSMRRLQDNGGPAPRRPLPWPLLLLISIVLGPLPCCVLVNKE